MQRFRSLGNWPFAMEEELDSGLSVLYIIAVCGEASSLAQPPQLACGVVGEASKGRRKKYTYY